MFHRFSVHALNSLAALDESWEGTVQLLVLSGTVASPTVYQKELSLVQLAKRKPCMHALSLHGMETCYQAILAMQTKPFQNLLPHFRFPSRHPPFAQLKAATSSTIMDSEMRMACNG